MDEGRQDASGHHSLKQLNGGRRGVQHTDVTMGCRTESVESLEAAPPGHVRSHSGPKPGQVYLGQFVGRGISFCPVCRP